MSDSRALRKGATGERWTESGYSVLGIGRNSSIELFYVVFRTRLPAKLLESGIRNRLKSHKRISFKHTVRASCVFCRFERPAVLPGVNRPSIGA